MVIYGLFPRPIQIILLLWLAFVHPFHPNYVVFSSFSLLETMSIKCWKPMENKENQYVFTPKY